MVARLGTLGSHIIWRPNPEPRLTTMGAHVILRPIPDARLGTVGTHTIIKRRAMRKTTVGAHIIHRNETQVQVCYDFLNFPCGVIGVPQFHNDPNGDNVEEDNPTVPHNLGTFERPGGGAFHPCPHAFLNAASTGGAGSANGYIHYALPYITEPGTLISVQGWGWRESGHDSGLRLSLFATRKGHTFADTLEPQMLTVPPPADPVSEFEYNHILGGLQSFKLPTFAVDSTGTFYVTLTESNIQFLDPPRRTVWSWQVFCILPTSQSYFIDTLPEP